MKNPRILATSALVALVAASTAFASTSLDRPAALDAAQPILPVPVKVVHPTELSRAYENVTVRVQFTLDKFGVPHNVAPVGHMPEQLASRLLPAVAKWQFTPCLDANGRPVQKKVILPLTLVDGAY